MNRSHRLLANTYRDSVALMAVAAKLSAISGVDRAVVVMATPANLAQAVDLGVVEEDGGAGALGADPNDLLVAVTGTAAGCDAALAAVDELLAGRGRGADDAGTGTGPSEAPPRSIGDAVARDPAVDVALISVPGAYATAEALKALRHGLHVMLFSDNVSVADEVVLKDEAAGRGLLLMGPDCGTAIVNGVPLGFANEVRRGSVGVVGASGTGLQEVTARVHRLGGGISQALGTGGRDLSEAVAARSTLRALAALDADPATEVAVIVSKPPHPAVRAVVMDAAAAAACPVVVAFLGLDVEEAPPAGVHVARSLAEAADLAVALAATGAGPNGNGAAASALGPGAGVGAGTARPPEPAFAGLRPARRWLRGSFAGGTFCAEAQVVLARMGIAAGSNAPTAGNAAVPAHALDGVGGHRLVDFGADELTRGRPHPMIEPGGRDAQLVADASAPDTAVVLFDVVLGRGAAIDPVTALVVGLAAATSAASEGGGAPALIAHVCGTDEDPQDRRSVIAQLQAAGVQVADSNAEAAAWAGWLVGGVAPAAPDAGVAGPQGLVGAVALGVPAIGVARPEVVAPRPALAPSHPPAVGRRAAGPGLPTGPDGPGLNGLLGDGLGVVTVGLDSFDAAVRHHQARLQHLDWRPPARGDVDTGRLLAALTGEPRVEEANRVAFGRFVAADPVLVGIARAADAVPGLTGERRLLHAGPPIAWAEMCGPMRGALVGAVLAERWAPSPEAALELLDAGRVALEPCHHHAAVGPMAGVIAPSMPVWVVENGAGGNRAFSNLNEGLGAVLRFGANGPAVLERLDWMATELVEVLGATLARLGPLPLKPLMAQALHMGDEVHNRNVAATGLLLRRLVPALVESGQSTGRQKRAVDFIAGNDHFFLNLSMAACKASLDAAHGVTGSSLVTAMARNGVRFGIRTAGTGDEWFEAPAQAVDGLYFAGYGPADAAADLGDSAITETAGLGGFAMAAAPAIVQFVGGTPADAVAHSRAMGRITLGPNPAFSLPALDFAPAAAGIDSRAVVDTGILPVINTGIAHRDAGVGQIGAGITTAPEACFTAAVVALAGRLVDAAARPEAPTGAVVTG